MTPNASLILDHWGFDQSKAKPTDLKQTRVYGWENLELTARALFDEIPNKYSHRMASYHRVDLHNGITALAEKCSSIKIKLGAAVTRVDCDAGTLQFADGSRIPKDLVVVADGTNSNLAQFVNGQETRTEKTGRSVFRTLIPMDLLMADPEVQTLFKGELPGYLGVPRPDNGNLLFTYPCRDNQVLNLAIFHNTHDHQKDSHDWNSDATVEDVLKVLQGYHPVWHRVFQKAHSIKVHTVGHRPECPRFVRGRAIVIGDAAHPMLPTYAQGGAMCLEDAASLEVLLASMKEDESLDHRLRIWEQLRVPRDVTTQLLSNGVFIWKTTAKEDLIRKYYKGPLFEPLDSPGFSRPVRDFWYGYDVFDEARKAFEYKDRLDGVPDGVLKFFETS